MKAPAISGHKLFRPLPLSRIEKHSTKNPFRFDQPALFKRNAPHTRPELFKIPSHPMDNIDCSETLEQENVRVHRSCTQLVKETRLPSKTFSSLELGTAFAPYQQILTEEIERNFDGIKSFLPTQASELADLEMYLPRTSKKTLVLDLDETLVHVLLTVPVCDANNSDIHLIYPPDPHDDSAGVPLVVRPFAKQLVQDLSKFYDIIVFFL